VSLVLIGSGLGAYLLKAYWSPPPVSSSDQIIGHAFFISSGQWNDSDSQGDNDELQIELQHLPAPTAGKRYYAWLLSDRDQNPPLAILLGALPVDQGNVHFHYVDPQHRDLIATTSRLLITEEDQQHPAAQPFSNQGTWRYNAMLPQESSPNGAVQPTALSCIRALLYQGPGIQGGLNIRLLRNTGKILEWVYSARDNWDRHDTGFIHRQMIRTLDYLDGKDAVQADVPPGTALLADTPLPLLPVKQGASSYLTLIHEQLTNLLAAPGITPRMRMYAREADQAITGQVQFDLLGVRQLAKQLVTMSDAELLLPSALALLDKTVALANVAFVGQLDPLTNDVEAGVVKIFYDIQLLATYDIRPYKS
jgi:hypothetical protein